MKVKNITVTSFLVTVRVAFQFDYLNVFKNIKIIKYIIVWFKCEKRD